MYTCKMNNRPGSTPVPGKARLRWPCALISPPPLRGRRIEAVVDAVAEGDATALAPVRLAIKQLRPDQEVKRELEACFQGIGAVWEEEVRALP